MPGARLTAVLLLLAAGAGASRPPKCRYTALSSSAPSGVAGEVLCTCRSFQPHYEGNLNFVKRSLQAAAGQGSSGSLDLVIRGCTSLVLELNLDTVGGRRGLNLVVEDCEVVRVVAVELAGEERVQSLVVRRVARLEVEGRVDCRGCRGRAGGLLNIQVTTRILVFFLNKFSHFSVLYL